MQYLPLASITVRIVACTPAAFNRSRAAAVRTTIARSRCRKLVTRCCLDPISSLEYSSSSARCCGSARNSSGFAALPSSKACKEPGKSDCRASQGVAYLLLNPIDRCRALLMEHRYNVVATKHNWRSTPEVFGQTAAHSQRKSFFAPHVIIPDLVDLRKCQFSVCDSLSARPLCLGAVCLIAVCHKLRTLPVFLADSLPSLDVQGGHQFAATM